MEGIDVAIAVKRFPKKVCQDGAFPELCQYLIKPCFQHGTVRVQLATHLSKSCAIDTKRTICKSRKRRDSLGWLVLVTRIVATILQALALVTL